MHRNKTFAGIFLIFSIANVTVALAAPALIRQRHFVTKRADEEPTGESKQDPAGLSHEEVEHPESPPSVKLPKWSENSPTLSELWSDGSLMDYLSKIPSDADSKWTVSNSPSGSYQGSPDVDSERTVFNSPSVEPKVDPKVEPAASPPSVGLPKWSENSPTLSELWSDGSLMDYLSKIPSDADSKWTVSNSPSGSHQGSSDADSERTVSNSPSGWHQGTPELVPGSPGFQDRPFPWWLYSAWRHPGLWYKGEPSYTASHGQMLPPASVAPPLHDDAHWSNTVTDMDQASTMSWSSMVSGWEEEEEEIAEKLHPHL